MSRIDEITTRRQNRKQERGEIKAEGARERKQRRKKRRERRGAKMFKVTAPTEIFKVHLTPLLKYYGTITVPPIGQRR